MPASAEKALEGMLSEGTDASAVLDALKSSGFDIKPPEGDDSYGEEAPDMGIGLMIATAEPEGEEGESKEDGAPEAKPDSRGGDQKPLSLFQRREKAARSAMKKHGYPTESEDEDE